MNLIFFESPNLLNNTELFTFEKILKQ